MSMVVQHNLTAMNSNRMLGITTGAQAKATEKLSSGYKINRAADDAAGLSISEKMRKQIRGLTQASANAQDGISAVQTAEGALTEVHDMLQRMNELANKAANGTESVSDRDAIQAEIEQLVTEIDRVSETTKFNETYLLKGDGTKGTKTLNAHDAGLDGTLVNNGNGTSTFTTDELKAGDSVTIGGVEYNIVGSQRTDDYTSMLNAAAAVDDIITQNGVKYTVTEATTNISDGGIKVKDADGNALELSTVYEGATLTQKATGKTTTLVGNATFDIAATTATTKNDWQAGDTVVDADGVEYTYVDTAKNAFLNDVMYKASGFYKSEGNTASDTAYTTVPGDTYTIAATGETGAIANTGIQTVADIQNIIKGASDGDTITIYDNANATGVEYTVGVTTDETGKAMTADDIAARLKEGQYVKDADDNFYYAVPSASESNTDISAAEAYRLMAAELQAASSIGADSGNEATVRITGDGKFEITQAKAEIDNSLSFNLHVGADADMTNKIGVSIQTMSAAGLGIKGLNVSDESGNGATYAIDAIADAIETVSAQRSKLGAVQNRLEHTINNLDNVVENTTSAESQIRDTDMATQMVEYSKNQILAQAGQSMLAQANQANQGVLSLLQ